jgi:integrase/recombinase XerD
MRVRNYAPETVSRRATELGDFITWAEARCWTRVTQITRPIVLRYQRHLFHQQGRHGQTLSFRSQAHRLIALRCWCRWLLRNQHLLHNPASDLELPKLGQCLPKAVLTQREVEAILAQPDVTTGIGIRDRAILETFYSTGIRRQELINLQLLDVDAERGTLMVRQGKGKKDRVVPMGTGAVRWAQKYRRDVRPLVVKHADERTFYLNHSGQPFKGTGLSSLVAQYVRQADIGKTGSCHLFRHSMATLMLENGADIRFIQAILGHLNLQTTEIYTRVSIAKLKEVHQRTHPGNEKAPDNDRPKDDSEHDNRSSR